MSKIIQWWQVFQQGSTVAYTELYNRFATPLYSYGIKFTKNVALVED
jgi:hypothetical protein